MFVTKLHSFQYKIHQVHKNDANKGKMSFSKDFFMS